MTDLATLRDLLARVKAATDGRPKRIQRKRTRGWRMPEGAVYVGRPSKWGNPYDWREWRENAPRDVLWDAREIIAWCREQAVEAFAADARDGLIPDVHELRGKDLVCWCPIGRLCHADVLLKLANIDSLEAS